MDVIVQLTWRSRVVISKEASSCHIEASMLIVQLVWRPHRMEAPMLIVRISMEASIRMAASMLIARPQLGWKPYCTIGMEASISMEAYSRPEKDLK